VFGEEDVVKSHLKRSFELSYFLIFAFVVLLSRVCYLQILNGEKLEKYSIENSLREQIVWAPRGKILSRNGTILVDNKASFNVTLTRQDLKNKDETIKELSKIINFTEKEISEKIKKHIFEARYKPIVIKRNVTQKEIALIETQLEKLPGVNVEISITREYLNEEVGAHFLGYISEIRSDQLKKLKKRDGLNYNLGDFIGQRGVEQTFDLVLRGVNGREYLEVDAFGRKRRSSGNGVYAGIKNLPPEVGGKLILTIDQEIQNVAYDMLKDKAGALVAIDVETGALIAMVSTPSFQPSQFAQGLDPDYWKSLLTNKRKPLRDKAIQEHYAPGSTFKVVTAVAGLMEGIINPKTVHFCDGSITLGRRTYHCWNKHGHGAVNLRSALRGSCNVYFQQIAKKLDIDVLAKYAKEFGLGQKTGIRVKRETSGLVPTKKWKLKNRGQKWTKGETLSCAIGQSYMLTNLLQLSVLYSALANGGKVYRPKIVQKAYNLRGELVEELKPELIKEVGLNSEWLKAINEGLHDVVNHERGTAFYGFDVEQIKLAGKTGTSQVVGFIKGEDRVKCDDAPYKYRHHALFAGFAPYDNPKVAIAAIVEHGCSGRRVVPIVKEVAKRYLEKYHPNVVKR